MNKRLIAFLSIFSLSLSLPLNLANGAEQCLAEFPDSAWTYGEPKEVKQKLNYDLVGKKTSNTQQTMFISLKFGNIDYITNYQYSGSNCTTRSIQIIKKSTDLQPVFFTFDDFKSYIKSKSANFQEESSNFEGANALNKVILDLNWDVNVNSSNLKTEDSFKFMSQDSVLKLYAALNKFSGSFPYRYVPILQALGECSFIPFLDEENVHNPGVNYYKAVVFQGAVARGLKFQTMSECQIAFLYASPTAIGLVYPGFGEEKIGFFKIGEFRVKPIAVKSNSKITITCTKGKTTKTVTGTNPKCPSGYKVKA